MVATSSTLVMHRTLWMAPTFCTATMAFGTLAFPHARVCTHSVLTRSWPLNYYYHLEEVSGLLMHFNWAWLFSFVATCTDPGLIDRGERNGTDFSHGQVVTFECSTKNCSLIGNPRLTCNDGVWDSALPVCKSEYPKIYHDRMENACTVSTSRCPIQSLRKLVWDNWRYLQCTHFPFCHVFWCFLLF